MPENKKGEYEFLEHTADIKYRAYGKDLNGAMENAARALFSVMTDLEHASKKEKFEIELQENDKEELVVEFLSTLLSEMEVRELVLSDVKIVNLMEFKGKWLLKATAFGEKKRPRDSVKAVTYHDLLIEEKPGKAMIQIVLDV